MWTVLQNGAQTTHFCFTHYTGWAWSNQMYAPIPINADACVTVKEVTGQFGPIYCIGQFTEPGAIMI